MPRGCKLYACLGKTCKSKAECKIGSGRENDLTASFRPTILFYMIIHRLTVGRKWLINTLRVQCRPQHWEKATFCSKHIQHVHNITPISSLQSTSFSSQRNVSIFSMGFQHHKLIRCDVSPWGLMAMSKAQWHWASDRTSIEHGSVGPAL